MRTPVVPRRSREPLLQERRRRHLREIRLEVLEHDRLVQERIRLGLGLEEEIERVDHRHVGDEIDLDEELRHLLGEHEAREVVAVRILLPVQEVGLRLDLQRIARDRRAANAAPAAGGSLAAPFQWDGRIGNGSGD